MKIGKIPVATTEWKISGDSLGGMRRRHERKNDGGGGDNELERGNGGAELPKTEGGARET